MVSAKDKGLLLYIVEHCIRIETVTGGLTKDEFLKNDDTKELSCFHILQIGELVKRFRPEFLEAYNGMPWKKIKGMRDIIVHGYGSIDFGEVWVIASEEIVPLHNYCQSIIDNN